MPSDLFGFAEIAGAVVCRGHLFDAQSEYSLLRSTTQSAISNLTHLIAP
jgi:hypothetical protein